VYIIHHPVPPIHHSSSHLIQPSPDADALTSWPAAAMLLSPLLPAAEVLVNITTSSALELSSSCYQGRTHSNMSYILSISFLSLIQGNTIILIPIIYQYLASGGWLYILSLLCTLIVPMYLCSSYEYILQFIKLVMLSRNPRNLAWNRLKSLNSIDCMWPAGDAEKIGAYLRGLFGAMKIPQSGSERPKMYIWSIYWPYNGRDKRRNQAEGTGKWNFTKSRVPNGPWPMMTTVSPSWFCT
jgi:hypothetical protein